MVAELFYVKTLTGGRTNMTKLTVAICNFANASKSMCVRARLCKCARVCVRV